MPDEGFLKWDYVAIAQHFYAKHQYNRFEQQEKAFHQVVSEIINMGENE